MKTILVTGGAGYIGSVVVKNLLDKGYKVIVVDNLSKGLKRLIDKRAQFHKIDLINKKDLEKVFKKNNFDSIIHFAAYKAVGESMKNPIKYSENITGTINLLDLMIKYKVKKIIYSSSAAVYGLPKEKILTEKSQINPINYYGFTKRICEGLIKGYSESYGINYVILRYFNVAGDGGFNYIDPSAENVLPIIMEVIFRKRDKFVIMGNGYPTRDGTCVRDYVDINDLSDAHILSLDKGVNEIINLGTQKGISVKELVEATIKVTGKELSYEFGEKRKGDAAISVASNEKAKKILGWQPKRSVEDMIRSTYDAYSKIL